MKGYISLHRKIIEWEWYDDVNTFKLFLHFLLRANHKNGKWKGVNIDPGQFVTGRKQLAQETGLSEQQIRTSINKLKSTNEITIKATSKFSVVTICNYCEYQSKENQINQQINQQPNQRATSNQPAINQQVTTNNNNNNNNNDKNENKSTIIKPTKKRFIKPTVAEIKSYCDERKNNIDPEHFHDYNEANGWRVGKNPMKDWKASIRTWEKNNYRSGTQKQFMSTEERYQQKSDNIKRKFVLEERGKSEQPFSFLTE